jgi:hypothetical protein
MVPFSVLALALVVGGAVVAQPTMEQSFEAIQSASEGIQTHAVSTVLQAVLGKAPPALTTVASALQVDANSSCTPPNANVVRYFNDMFLSFGVREKCGCDVLRRDLAAILAASSWLMLSSAAAVCAAQLGERRREWSGEQRCCHRRVVGGAVVDADGVPGVVRGPWAVARVSRRRHRVRIRHDAAVRQRGCVQFRWRRWRRLRRWRVRCVAFAAVCCF